jgi:hypothetical protein
MSAKARIDVSVVYHEANGGTFSVGSLADNVLTEPTSVQTLSGTVGTVAVSIGGTGTLTTLAIKNTGAGVLRVAGAIDIAAGRVAVLPVAATVTVSAPSGSGSYTAIRVG